MCAHDQYQFGFLLSSIICYVEKRMYLPFHLYVCLAKELLDMHIIVSVFVHWFEHDKWGKMTIVNIYDVYIISSKHG